MSVWFRPSLTGQEGLPGEEASFKGNRLTFDRRFRQRRFQVLDTRISDRNLGIDDCVDDKAKAICGIFQRRGRPREPSRVLGHDVEQDVAVDENGTHSVVACQRHDGVRGHGDIAAPA